MYRIIIKIYFMFSKYVQYHYTNILHVPYICTIWISKYSLCSLDMYRMIIKIFFMFSMYRMIMKIYFMFSKYVQYDYTNILHVPYICTIWISKYSLCSLDMYRMIMKIFFMFSRYVQDDYENILHIL